MLISIHGPNLATQFHGQFIAHAADCSDNGRVKCHSGRQSQPFTVDVESREQCALEIYEDQLQGGECDLETALADIHFCPCCRELG